MTEIDVLEAMGIFEELLDRVERGEEIVILRSGRPVARLVPFVATPAEDAASRLLETRKGVMLGGISLADLINADRR